MSSQPIYGRRGSKRPPARGGRGSKHRVKARLEVLPVLSRLPLQRGWSLQRVVALLLVMTLGWFTWQCLTSPTFKVDAPEVVGNRTLPASELAAVTRSFIGQNIFLIDRGQVAAAVRALPGVKDVRVDLILPNRLIINIQDQEPQVIWEVRGIQYWVDSNGVVIRPGNVEGKYLLIIDPNPQARPLERGQQVDKQAIATVQQLNSLLAGVVKSYEWSSNSGITVVAQEGWRAIIGWDDRLEAKVEVLRAILKYAAERRLSLKTIDVRVPERPAYTTAEKR